MRRKLQSDDSTLHGVQVVEIGEAEGHDFAIGQEFLSAVVELGNAAPVKVRMNHPEGRGDVASIVGEATNFVLDGKCVRADVHLFDLPEKSRLLTLAQQAGHLFGMSLDFAGEVVKKAGQKLKEMTCDRIFAVDFVDTPAATRALFSAGETKNQWRVVCRMNVAAVDSQKQVETNMTKQTLSKLCKKFGIDEKAKDAEDQVLVKLEALADAPPVEDEDEEDPIKEVLSKLTSMEARLAKLEGGNDEDEEKLAEFPPKKEDKETEMATMAAKVCSIMLAKVGIKPRAASAPGGDGHADEGKLDADSEKIALSLKMDDKERKQFAANLARAKTVKL